MGVSSVIKYFLTEVGGISFESRKWAEIIEKYVSDVLEKEEKKVRPQNDFKVEPDYSEYGEDEYDLFPTHFIDSNGEKSNLGFVYGSKLVDYINNKELAKIVENMLFSVELDFGFIVEVDVVEGEIDESWRDIIEYVIEDYLLDGGSFVDDEYNELKAVHEPNSKQDSSYNYKYSSNPTIDKIEIEGKDFPEAYENFKVDRWVINDSSRIEYDHWKSGYNEKGEYIVYLNIPIYSVSGSALVHEVKHAFDDWNRMSKGYQPIRSSWEIKNIYTPDFEKLVLGGVHSFGNVFSDIIKSYYMGSKLETPAYLENEYDYPEVKTYRRVAKKMMDFKASDYLDEGDNFTKYLQRNWSDLITKYDIPFFRKFKNVGDFLKYTEKHFNKRGRDILRKIDKMLYLNDKLGKK